jgi:hypothetical protein
MRRAIGFLLMLSAAVLCAGSSSALAEPVDGTWENADTFPPNAGDNGPYSTTTSNSFVLGEDPDDPDFSSQWAVQEMIFSPFSTMTLTNPGDKVVFTGSVALSGTTNSPLTSGTPRTQFRFGLFQSNASTNETGWVGYYMSNKHGNAGTPSGVLALKPVANTSAFLAVGGQTVLTSVQGEGTDASLFNDGTYNLMLSIERNAGGELEIDSSILGTGFQRDGVTPNTFSQIFDFTTTDAATTGTYVFDRLGFLLGNNLATDRAEFMNLDVTFMPGVAAGLAGDFNEDDVVDAADYVKWRLNETTNNPLPNDNGLATQAERYDLWTANFGATAPGGGSAAVPEPEALVLVVFGALVVISWRRWPKPAMAPIRS